MVIGNNGKYTMPITRFNPVVEGDTGHLFDGEMRRRKHGDWVRYSDHCNQSELMSGLLWDAFMIMDHGDHDERLALLEKLESHFKKTGKTASRT